MNACDWQRKGFYAALEAETLSLLIYGPLGMGEGEHVVQAAAVVQQIQDFAGPAIDIYINSPGGIVYEGLAIYNALRRHPARKTVHIDGICASAATIVAMAGDRIIAADNATLMVHAPWQTVSGTANDLRKDAQVLDQLTDTLVNLYVQRTGRPRDEVARWVAEETWFTAAEAMRLGLIDAVASASRAVAQWDCAAFGLMEPPRRQDAKIAQSDLEAARGGDFDALETVVAAVVSRHLSEAGQTRAAKAAIQAAVEASLAAVQTVIETFMASLQDGLTGVENRFAEYVDSRCESVLEAYRADRGACADGAAADPADLVDAAPADDGSSAMEQARDLVAGWNPRPAAPQG